MTIEWDRFSVVDKLLKEWIDNSLGTCDADSILSLVQVKMRRRHYWPVASLLEECCKSHGWAGKRFEAQALRCMALGELSEIVKDPSKAKTNRAIAQAGFASWSLGTEGLSKAANESMEEAMQMFDNLDKPTRRQQILRRKLGRMSKGGNL